MGQEQWTPEAIGIDPDLYSASCMGIGVRFPHLWETVKRYILRGDEWFQAGGLSVLAATTWAMPLNEATDVLEEYFRKHDFLPQIGGRGGIDLGSLKAAYAVATTPGFDEDAETQWLRRARILALLERYEVAVRQSSLPEDSQVVRETIEAIRNDQPGFEPRFPETEDMESPVEVSSNGHGKAFDGAMEQGISHEEVERIVARAVDSVRHELVPVTLTEMDRVTMKHGYEMLEQRLLFLDRRTSERLDDLSKSVDRYMGEQQVRTGDTQVGLAKQSNWLQIAAVVLSLVAIIVTLGMAVMGG